ETEAPTESPEATESPSPRPTRTRTPSPEPSEEPTTEPPETTKPPTTEPSPTLSFSPSPVETTPAETPTATATETVAATESGGSTAWIWIVVALVVVAGIVTWALLARARGQRTSAWRTRARDPFSEGVVLHDRVKADLLQPRVADARLDESLSEVDRIG